MLGEPNAVIYYSMTMRHIHIYIYCFVLKFVHESFAALTWNYVHLLYEVLLSEGLLSVALLTAGAQLLSLA